MLKGDVFKVHKREKSRRIVSMSSNQLQKFLGGRFRTILSGSPDAPPWLEEVASGDDPGLFLPTDAPWIVHANMATLVGGVRALLMQALHPGTLAGVAQHSRYEKDHWVD